LIAAGSLRTINGGLATGRGHGVFLDISVNAGVIMRTIVNRSLLGSAAWFGVMLSWLAAVGSAEDGWIDLIGKHGFEHWRSPTGDWKRAGDAEADPKNPARQVAKAGDNVILNGPAGRSRNLVTKESFGDLEAHFEFKIPKGSNSGVKLEGFYEIQIHDSFGVAVAKATHAGGVYPRAEMLPIYHHIDEGIPPRVNAAKKAGEWQTLDIVFRAPRFDADGKKIKSARFDKVVLNGQVIHDQVEVKTPTGNAWKLKEIPRGPLLLQGDHGPVAFRNIRVRELK
jgi:Domain of Unknown Function (DUF1080)